MASSSLSIEIAGGSKPAFAGRKLRRLLPSLKVIPPARRRMTAAAALAFRPVPQQTSSISPVRFDSPASFSGGAGEGSKRISPQKLDEWMRDSIGEIVRNVGKAPFLVQIFSGEGDRMEGESESRLMLEKEAATAENWSGIKKRWERESSVPDGVILVEELGSGEEEEGEATVSASQDDGCRRNERWGVVIQGRGMDSTACYILNTCKVRSSVGFCTHFCLVRAKCFGDPAGVQLRNVWLQAPER